MGYSKTAVQCLVQYRHGTRLYAYPDRTQSNKETNHLVEGVLSSRARALIVLQATVTFPLAFTPRYLDDPLPFIHTRKYSLDLDISGPRSSNQTQRYGTSQAHIGLLDDRHI
jgi:hypothetical protein